ITNLEKALFAKTARSSIGFQQLADDRNESVSTLTAFSFIEKLRRIAVAQRKGLQTISICWLGIIFLLVLLGGSAIFRFFNLSFTLVELLVCLMIFFTFLGLLLPARQIAREASTRAFVADKLQQLGIATHAIHDAYGVLPALEGAFIDLGAPFV